MSVPRPASVPKYDITSIVPETDFNPQTGSVPSHRFSFTTQDGISSSVLVPDSVVNDVAAGRQLIEARIVALTAYKALGK